MKKKFMLHLLLTISLTSFCVTFLIGSYSKSIITEILNNIKNDTARQLENHFKIYDDFLLMVENQLKEKSRAALFGFNENFLGYEVTLKASAEELKRFAGKAGVDEVYFINKDGVVYNTSFVTDLNLNLNKTSKDFEIFLNSVRGKNEVVFHRISSSTLTGAINFYAYFSPVNSDYIIEISIKVNQHLNSITPNYWEKFKKDIFHGQVKYISYLDFMDIYAINNYSAWSFINEGKIVKMDKTLMEKILNDKELIYENGDRTVVYKAITFDHAGYSWSPERIILEMNFNFGILNQFEKKIMLYSVTVCIVIIIILFLFSSMRLNQYIVKRIININEALNQVACGIYNVEIKDGEADEISQISRNINSMTKMIEKQVKSLEELLPICASCKKIRDDKGYWEQVESYLLKHSGIKFSHGMCPECTKKYFPEYYNKKMSIVSSEIEEKK